jgi:hypothetical protein
MKRILILSANPKNTDNLRLNEEIREIKAALHRSEMREQFEIIDQSALRVEDLSTALLHSSPHIVHFSGHGAGEHGLALENHAGQMQLVSTTALAELCGLFKSTLECVVLNACYSEVQAEEIYQHINCVIGMNQAIGNRAAIKFAVGFYDAIGADKSYQDAYAFSCNAINLEGIPESSTPVIRCRQDSKPEKVTVDRSDASATLDQSDVSATGSITITGGDGSKIIGKIDHVENLTM